MELASVRKNYTFFKSLQRAFAVKETLTQVWKHQAFKLNETSTGVWGHAPEFVRFFWHREK